MMNHGTTMDRILGSIFITVQAKRIATVCYYALDGIIFIYLVAERELTAPER